MSEMASSADPSLVADRLRTALDLMATGVEMTRQRLRREFPSETTQEIADRVDQWLRRRPGAEHGDGPQPERQ